MIKKTIVLLSIFCYFLGGIIAQNESVLTVERIYSEEFTQESFGPSKWLEDGAAYTTLELQILGVLYGID